MALSSGNLSKYEFFNWQRCFTGKAFLEKAVKIKRPEYSPLGSKLEKETDIVEKQYHRLNKFLKSNEKQEPVVIKKEEPKITEELKLDYHSKYSFTDYSSIGKNYDLYFTAKYDIFFSFYHRLNIFKNLIPWSEKNKK